MRRTWIFLVVILLGAASWPGLGTWGSVSSAQQAPTLSLDLRIPGPGELVRVIVQAPAPALDTLRRQMRTAIRRDLGTALAMEVDRNGFLSLTSNTTLLHLSGDAVVRSEMALSNQVTGAAAVWQESGTGLLSTTAGYDGTSVGIAIGDSGIASHTALGARVVARANFVSWESDVAGDACGHGTHIAGSVGGALSRYGAGSAPDARLIDVRVLGRNGMGMTSDVIAGINWAVANRSKYGIRVITLALGHPVVEPSLTDPLARAVARASAAGIVVVASAGNYGRTANGAPVLGGIASPGNSPYALTVGALDTFGTAATGDDRVAPFSSRGPTRFEFAVKPDLVAPGTRIVSLEARLSYLSKTYPAWHIGGSGRSAYMRLSGSSMATGVVAGGAALLLDAYPHLTPEQVKFALQAGSRYLPQDGLIAGGAGSVSFAEAMKVAKAGVVQDLLVTTLPALNGATGAAYIDGGRMIDGIYDRSGIRLFSLDDLRAVFGGMTQTPQDVITLVGLQNPLAGTPANDLVWGEVAGWSSSYYLVWGTSVQSPSGQYLVWGTSDTSSGYTLRSTATPPDANQ